MSSLEIIINGSVAVGKSHLQKVILNHFINEHPVLYPEFIYEDSVAMELLKRRFQGTISALTFQNFILDKWELLQKQTPGKINIYERLPDDAVEVFSNMALTEKEFEYHKERLEKLTVPKYSDMNKDNAIWIRYDNDFKRSINPLLEKLDELYQSGKYKYVIVEVLSKTAYENYKHRNREGEIYTPEELTLLYEVYGRYTTRKIKEIGCELITV